MYLCVFGQFVLIELFRVAVLMLATTRLKSATTRYRAVGEQTMMTCEHI